MAITIVWKSIALNKCNIKFIEMAYQRSLVSLRYEEYDLQPTINPSDGIFTCIFYSCFLYISNYRILCLPFMWRNDISGVLEWYSSIKNLFLDSWPTACGLLLSPTQCSLIMFTRPGPAKYPAHLAEDFWRGNKVPPVAPILNQPGSTLQ